MDETDFEGSVVLEKMSAVGLLEEFWLAVDNDDPAKVKRLMRNAGLDLNTIAIVLKKMADAG